MTEVDTTVAPGRFYKCPTRDRLSTLLGVGTEIGSGDNENEIAKAIRESAQDTASDVGQQLVGRQFNIQPTPTIRPGFPVRIIVNRDLVVQPYGAAKERL